MSAPEMKTPQSQSAIPQASVGSVAGRPAQGLQFNKPFATQPQNQASMAELLASGGTQRRPTDQQAALEMLKQGRL